MVHTQTFIALCSGDAECYGVVQGSSVGLDLRSMLADMGVGVQVHIHTDATAAKGIASRKGLSSRTGHVAVRYFWVQECVIYGDIVVHTFTDEINRDLITRHSRCLNLLYLHGCAECAHALSA